MDELGKKRLERKHKETQNPNNFNAEETLELFKTRLSEIDTDVRHVLIIGVLPDHPDGSASYLRIQGGECNQSEIRGVVYDALKEL